MSGGGLVRKLRFHIPVAICHVSSLTGNGLLWLDAADVLALLTPVGLLLICIHQF
jgi:hypothetical protein